MCGIFGDFSTTKMGNFLLIRWELYSEPCEFYRRSIAIGSRLGRAWPCFWCWWEMSLGSQELSEWIHNPKRLARRAFKYLIVSRMFRNIVFKPCFYFFLQTKYFQSPFLAVLATSRFHSMDFLSLNNPGFHIESPPVLWNSLNSEVLSRNNSRREIQCCSPWGKNPRRGTGKSWWGWNLQT